MPDHTPTDAHDVDEAQASVMNEENPPTVPEGIAVRDMMRVKYEPRASNEVLIITGYSGAVVPVPPAHSKTLTGTSSTTCRRRCCPRSSA